ncbi:MAG: hypothetical protein IPJ88_16855 [Myxococcales bacterium]|nr:MAG: hypothetical protein IPJ88_16855 [Myxococcales bacterium]
MTVPILPTRMQFDNTVNGPTLHRAGFASRHAEEAHAQAGLCTTCHSERFCSNCHRDRGIHGSIENPVSPHPPGWVGALSSQNDHGRAARRDPAACASCHDGAGQMLCVECHRVGGIGGSPHPSGFSSSKGQNEMPCRLCHLTP